MSYILDKILWSNFLIIPILLVVVYLIFPYYLYNAYYVAFSGMISSCAFLYRFDKLVFIMHQKPTYFEKATVFKTQIENVNSDMLLEEDGPEIKLIREIDTYLTKKFRKIFKHVLIIIDSFMCGILFYWIFMHFTTDERDRWVKNIGIFGGYVSICGKAHIYIGRTILFFLKKNKDTVREKEMKRRRKLSDEFYDNKKGSIELVNMSNDNQEEQQDEQQEEDNIQTSMLVIEEGYMDYFEMDFMANSGIFTEDEDDDDEEEDTSSSSEGKEEMKEIDLNKDLKMEDTVLDIDTNPPKTVMLVNKIRNIVMFRKPKDIGYTPNTIIIHY